MVLIRPKYHTLPDKKDRMSAFELAEYVNLRGNIKSKNVGIYYKALYDSLRTTPLWRGRRLKIRNPEEYGMVDNGLSEFQFNPDCLSLFETGPVYGEVKASGFQNAKFWCSPVQFLRYWQLLEDRIREFGDDIPNLNYGFFRYGFFIPGIPGVRAYDCKLHECEKSGKKINGEKHLCDNRCLTTNLINKTHDLTIIPINLLIAIFMSEKFQKQGRMNQLSSQFSWDHQDYSWVKGKLCTSLHGARNVKQVSSIRGLLGNSILPKTYEVLGLDRLRIVRESVSGIFCLPHGISGFPYKIRDFPVVRIEMSEKDEREWIKNFRNYGRDILRFSLGIANLEGILEEPDSFEGMNVNSSGNKVPF